MVEFRPAGLGVWFWVGFGVFVPFSTICLFFPSFNDDLGTMPTRRPYSWKKFSQALVGRATQVGFQLLQIEARCNGGHCLEDHGVLKPRHLPSCRGTGLSHP